MSILKSLLDIQKDIRNLENSILEISANIKQVNDDIDELRNQDNSIDFDYEEIKKLSQLIPFKKHPINKIEDEETVRLYLETLVNIIKFDDKNVDDKVDTRLVFIQWLLNNSKLNINLEELIISSLRVKISDFDKLTLKLSKKSKELLIVDLLIIANMSGTFNEDECNYVVDVITIVGVDASKLKLLTLIAKMVLCQKSFEFDVAIGNDLIKELGNYRHYVLSNITDVVNSMPTDIIKEAIKSMRTTVVEMHSEKTKNFKWKCKQQDKVVCGDVIATYQKERKKRGYSFTTEYETKEILASSEGTIFQFRDNNIIYGVISHDSDNKDSIKQWIKNAKR